MVDSTTRIRQLIGRSFDLPESEIDAVAQAFGRRVLPGGEWLFRQGDPGDSLYLLVRGRLQVWIQRDAAGADEDDEPLFVGEVLPGETVGEISLLSGQPRSAGICAARDSLLLEIDRAGFQRLSAVHPNMAMQLAGSLAVRLQQRTAGHAAPGRRLVNICLLQLDNSPALLEFIEQLVAAIAALDDTLVLVPEDLARSGAPVAELGVEDAIPAGLTAWLDEQEYRYRFVIYVAHPATSPWSQLAVRQADLVVRVGAAGQSSELRTWESIADRAESGRRLVKQALLLLQPGNSETIEGTRDWLEPRTLDFHLHARHGNQSDLARAARLLTGRGLGLVLGAGAARGLAHIGVYRALVEAGLVIDWVAGTSIGAIIGAGIAKGWSPEVLEATGYQRFVIDKPFSGITLPMVSLLSARRMMNSTRKALPGHIEDLPIPFFCVSCNLDSGKPNIHDRGLLADALRASAAMPGALPPAVFRRHLVVDGAVINGLPVDLMREQPVAEVIAVDLSSHKTYEVDYQELPSAWRLLRARLLPFGKRYRVPGLVTVLLKSTEIGSLKRVQEQGRMADLLLNPDVRRFSMTDVKSFRQLVEVGYRETSERLPAWLASRQPK